jgi:hypothetical protein
VGRTTLETPAQNGGYPSAGIPGILDNCMQVYQRRIPTVSWATSGCGGTTEAAVQNTRNIEDMAGYTPASVGESEQWSSIVNTVEENRANFCKALSGKTLYSALHGTYTVTLNELKGLLKTSTTAKSEQQGHHTRTKASTKFTDVSGTTRKKPPKHQRKWRSSPRLNL